MKIETNEEFLNLKLKMKPFNQRTLQEENGTISIFFYRKICGVISRLNTK